MDDPNEFSPRWLRLAEIERREGIPARTIEREIARGNLPWRTFKTGTERGCVFVLRRDYDAWRAQVETAGADNG